MKDQFLEELQGMLKSLVDFVHIVNQIVHL